MADIFLSYSSADKERVRPIWEALVAQGFEVFWDQEVPANVDWDTWIRQHLADSKCAIVFWSSVSIGSRNVRHEATIADREGKLIPVLLEPLDPKQFPMGLYTQQAVNLADWNADLEHTEWCKLRREYEAKLTPPWVREHIAELESELTGQGARRQDAERRSRALEAQLSKKDKACQDLERERDRALDEVVELKATVGELTQVRADAAQAQQALKRERDKALHEAAERKATIEELTRARSDASARAAQAQTKPYRPEALALFAIGIATGAAIIGYGSHQLINPAPVSELTKPVVLSAQPSGTNAGVTSASNRDRTTTSELNAAAAAGFTVRTNTEAKGNKFRWISSVATFTECQQQCVETCKVFSYNKTDKRCVVFENATGFQTTAGFDTGIRD